MGSYSDLVASQTEQQDEQRTKRAFVGFLSSVLGVDQVYTNDDASASQASGQYIIANPDGTYSRLGQPVSNIQRTSAGGLVLSPGLLILAGLAFFLLRR